MSGGFVEHDVPNEFGRLVQVGGDCSNLFIREREVVPARIKNRSHVESTDAPPLRDE